MSNPFSNQPEAKIEALTAAAVEIRNSINALRKAAGFSKNWGEYSSIESYCKQLEEFMCCDGGEAGFEIFVLNVSDDVFLGKRNPLRDAHELAQKYK